MSTTTVTITDQAAPAPAAPPKQDQIAVEQAKVEQLHRAESTKVLKERRAAHAKTEEPEKKRDESGKFASDKPKQETAASEPEKKADPEAKKEPETPTYDKGKYEEAMKALLLDGTFGPDELATLPPDVVIAKGEKAKKRQKDVDTEYKRGKDALGELETLKAKLAEVEASKANPAPGTTDAKTQTAKALASVQALTSKIKESLGDDIDLQGDFDALAQEIIAASKPDLSGVQKELESHKAMYESLVASHERPKVVERFEELADDSKWNETMVKAKALVKSGVVSDLASGLMSAAAMEYGLAAATKAAQRAKAIDEAKKNGQPYSGRQTTDTPAPTKPEDAAKATLKELRQKYASETR